MNVFAANDLEAADLLALARLDDDGAPPAVMIEAAPGRARQQLGLALMASGSAAPFTPPARPYP